MSGKMKKILSVVADILVILVILLAIVVSISSFTSRANGGVPNLFGYTAFSIKTDSMSPTIKAGDYILGEKCDSNELKAGDVITYFTIYEGQRIINTHRIVDVIDDNGLIYFQTQGDNPVTNPTPDEELVAPGDVISRYNGTLIPKFGFVMTFLGTQLGFFICILVPVLLFTIWQIYKLILTIMHNQKVKLLEGLDEAETEKIKEAVIAEYLAKQKEQTENQEDNVAK